MRFGSLLLVLFVAAPVLAEHRSETIHLRYLAPDTAREMLLANTIAQPVKNPDAVETQSGVRFLLPPGISAVAANPLDRTITVAGEPQAIEQVQRVLRLLDVPPRRVKLSVEILKLKPGSELPVKTAERSITGRTTKVSICEGLTDEQVDRLHSIAETQMLNVSVESLNNQPIFTFPHRAGESKPAVVTVVASVNGDGTISWKVGGNGLDFPNGFPAPIFGRAFPGERCLMLPTTGEAWLFHAEILPDRPHPGD